MRRRKLLTLLAGATASQVGAAGAQQASHMQRVGVIDDAPIWDNFRQQLRQLGHIEGQNLAIEYRAAQGEPDQLVAAAKALAVLPVDLIAVFGSSAAKAAQMATDKVPVVAISIGD